MENSSKEIILKIAEFLMLGEYTNVFLLCKKLKYFNDNEQSFKNIMKEFTKKNSGYNIEEYTAIAKLFFMLFTTKAHIVKIILSLQRDLPVNILDMFTAKIVPMENVSKNVLNHLNKNGNGNGNGNGNNNKNAKQKNQIIKKFMEIYKNK